MTLTSGKEVKIHRKRASGKHCWVRVMNVNAVLVQVPVKLETSSLILQDLRLLPFQMLLTITNFLSTFSEDVLFVCGLQIPLCEIEVKTYDQPDVKRAVSHLVSAGVPLSQCSLLEMLVDNALDHWTSDDDFARLNRYVASARAEL